MADHRARAVDRVVGGYLLVSSAALTFPARPDSWLLLLALHLAAAAALFGGVLGPVRRRAAAAARAGSFGRWMVAVAFDWYPLIVLPLLYLELAVLNTAVWDGRYFDPVIMGWEKAVFGLQPSMILAERWDSPVLSETLHLAYLSYYPIVYLLPLWLYLAGRTKAFHRTVFALMLGFGLHYLVFIGFPVHGPRYLTSGTAGTGGVIHDLTHLVLETGSSEGAAFPSSHVAAAAIQTGNAVRFAPRAVPLFALATVGIAVGAVYGGFHYATDAAVGLVTGSLVAVVAPTAWRWLR
ncbi:MAG: phosphatase PAP2 family protein [Gemmatimonadota bacterium]